MKKGNIPKQFKAGFQGKEISGDASSSCLKCQCENYFEGDRMLRRAEVQVYEERVDTGDWEEPVPLSLEPSWGKALLVIAY